MWRIIRAEGCDELKVFKGMRESNKTTAEGLFSIANYYKYVVHQIIITKCLRETWLKLLNRVRTSYVSQTFVILFIESLPQIHLQTTRIFNRILRYELDIVV